MKNIYVLSFLAIFFGVFFLQSCGSAESSTAVPSIDAPIPVKVALLKQEEISRPVNVSGQFTTDDETTLSFKTGGIVNRVLVKEGDYVRRGQLLATLDLTEINAQVKQASLAYEKAKRDFTRAENLYKDSVATLEQYQNARTAMSVAEQQQETARFNLGFSEIKAVADGYVLRKHVNPGQMIGPGAPVLRTNGAGKAHWVFKAAVSDKEWAVLKPGDSARLQTDAFPGKTIQAVLERKAEEADPSTGAFGLELKVEAGQQEMLASGLFGTATIFPAATSRVWPVPHESLLDANANKGFVFVTFDQKTASRQQVAIAFIDNDFVYASEGLENGASLITSGSAYLADSSSITVIP